MRWTIILILSLTTHLFSVSRPHPIEGTPFFSSGGGFTAQSGDVHFSFNFPSGWGVGVMDPYPDGSGHFELFPSYGGNGCIIDIQKFERAELVAEELARLRKSFKSTKDLKDGFEAELPKAWYSCRAHNFNLIHTWYPLPKKSSKYQAIWEILKECISLSNTSKPSYPSFSLDKPIADVKAKFPIVEVPYRGWLCTDPENTLQVLFEAKTVCSSFENAILHSSFDFTCTPCEENTAGRLLKIENYKALSYYYIKWGEKNFDTAAPFQKHLEQILADIKEISDTQKMSGSPRYDLKEGYAVWEGTPFTFITLSGDGFLFGFASKPKTILEFDMNDLIEKVKWVKID